MQVIQHRLLSDAERTRPRSARRCTSSCWEPGAAHEIIAQLERAEDALDRVVFSANDLVGAADYERAAKLGAHRNAVAVVRTYIKAVVTHAESLFRAERVAKGQIPSEREQSA